MKNGQNSQTSVFHRTTTHLTAGVKFPAQKLGGAVKSEGQDTWIGLWNQCVMQTSSQMQCPDNNLILPIRMQLWIRQKVPFVYMASSILGVLLGAAGNFISFAKEERKKQLINLSGFFFVSAGTLFLTPVSWMTNISATFPNLEMGISLYLGWLACFLQISGGGELTRYRKAC